MAPGGEGPVGGRAFALGSKARRAGWRLAAFDTVGSTNTEALARARAGDPGRLWVVAREQTAGRGRRGKAWSSPRGNLFATVLLTGSTPAATAATLGLVAGLVVESAVSGLLPRRPGRPPIALKWPNDVYCGDAKLNGTLIEAEQLPDGRLAVVVGMGVNVAAAPEGLPYPATSLAALGAAADAEAVFERLSDAWVDVASVWDEGRGLEPIRRAWLERARGLGGPIEVRVGAETVAGVFETIDADGRLVLSDPAGRRRTITAGEVFFGGTAGSTPRA